MSLNRFRSALGLAGALAAVAALVFAATGYAEEQAPATTPVTARTRQIHGTVKSVDTTANSFVVTTVRHGDVKVTIPSTGLAPRREGRGREERVRARLVTQISELHAMDRVVVQGRGQGDGTFVARRIHLLRHANVQHVVGTFKSFSGSTLTVTVNGADRQFTVNSSTVVRPADRTLASVTGTPRITVVTRDGTTATAVQIHT